MYSYTASGSIGYRHFLRFVGVDPAAIQWWVGDIDTPCAASMDQTLPPGVSAPAKGRSLSTMLLDGELEAIYSPPRPEAYHPDAGPIARLFPDFRQIEHEYFRKTGAFPPQHLIVLRREAWEANRWIAKEPHRGVQRRQRVLHRVAEGIPVRHAVAGSGARGHGG